jgi:hypothetical protein
MMKMEVQLASNNEIVKPMWALVGIPLGLCAIKWCIFCAANIEIIPMHTKTQHENKSQFILIETMKLLLTWRGSTPES